MYICVIVARRRGVVNVALKGLGYWSERKRGLPPRIYWVHVDVYAYSRTVLFNVRLFARDGTVNSTWSLCSWQNLPYHSPPPPQGVSSIFFTCTKNENVLFLSFGLQAFPWCNCYRQQNKDTLPPYSFYRRDTLKKDARNFRCRVSSRTRRTAT